MIASVGFTTNTLLPQWCAPLPQETVPRDEVHLGQRPALAAQPSLAAPVHKAKQTASTINRERFRMGHDLRVQLYPEQGTMYAEDRLTISRVPSDGRVGFMLNESLRIREISIDGERLQYNRDGAEVQVNLKDYKGDPCRLRVKYGGPVPGKENGPKGVFLYDETFWHPSHLEEHGASRLIVSLPETWSATSTGRETGTSHTDGRRSYAWETPWAGTGLSLAAAQYNVTEQEKDGIKYRTFLFPESEADAAKLVDRSSDVLKFFAPRFGDYPYNRLDIVESATEGGGGVPGVILFHPSVLQDTASLDDFLSHELSHNWWAGTLAGYTARGLWYEAFAEFSANLFTRGAVDSTTANADRKRVLDTWRETVGAAGATPVREATSYEPWDEKHCVAYEKGAFVLHMLRDKLGDETFFEGMRKFVHDGRQSLVNWDDVQDAFEGAAAQDLDTFFDQWLDRGDAPSFALQDVRVESQPGGWRIDGAVLQLQEGAPYEVELPLLIKTAQGEVRRTITLGAREGSFSYTLPGQPDQVQIDPEARIFRLTSEQEIWQAGRSLPPATLQM